MLAVSAVSASAALVSQPLASRRHGAGRCAVHMGEPPKIVVTGVGTVTAVGSGDEFWSNLIGGVSGVDTISAFDASKFPTTIGAECKDFNAKEHFSNPKNVKATDRYTHLAVAASRMAVDDAGLDLEKVEKHRFGVVVGSAFGGMDTFEKQVLQLDKGKKISPFAIPQLLGNTASGMIGIELGAQGPNYGVASACAAGSHALGTAFRHMQNGEADVMLSGGALSRPPLTLTQTRTPNPHP